MPCGWVPFLTKGTPSCFSLFLLAPPLIPPFFLPAFSLWLYHLNLSSSNRPVNLLIKPIIATYSHSTKEYSTAFHLVVETRSLRRIWRLLIETVRPTNTYLSPSSLMELKVCDSISSVFCEYWRPTQIFMYGKHIANWAISPTTVFTTNPLKINVVNKYFLTEDCHHIDFNIICLAILAVNYL